MSQNARDPQLDISLREADPELAAAITSEALRQRDHIELIASENYTSAAVREAQGSILTNKYAEGYPGKRYYAGCEFIDDVENLARTRALQLFAGSEHVTLRGLQQVERVRNDEPGFVRPQVLIAGASAYPRRLDFERFARIAQASGAQLMVDMAHISGIVAAGLHPSPFPHADLVTTTTHKTLRGPRGGMAFVRASAAAALDKSVFPGNQGGPLMHVIAAKAVAFKFALEPAFRTYIERTLANAQTLAAALAACGFGVITGGTDTHLILCDVTPLGVTGKEATLALESVGITINKNSIPGETRSPMVTSREVSELARTFPVPGRDATMLAEEGSR